MSRQLVSGTSLAKSDKPQHGKSPSYTGSLSRPSVFTSRVTVLDQEEPRK